MNKHLSSVDAQNIRRQLQSTVGETGAREDTSLVRSFPVWLMQKYLAVWKGKPPQPSLLALSVAVSLFMTIPLGYVILRAIQGGAAVWERLLSNRIPYLIINTLEITGATIVVTLFLGTALALLTQRTDLPGAKYWNWLFSFPLVIPAYIGAFTYITLIGPRGITESSFLPSIYSFWGTLFVLAAFTYPYVYLLAASGLQNTNANIEEAARIAGLSQIGVFHRVTLPMLRPSLGAGCLLVALYVLSDFGTVTMLRFDTFTSAVYQQLVGRYDRSAAAVLSSLLVMFSLFLLWLDVRNRKRAKFYQTVGTFRNPQILSLGVWKWPALIFVSLVVALSSLLPIGLLIFWTVQGYLKGSIEMDFFSYSFNSLSASALAATAATLLSLPVAYLQARHPSTVSSLFMRLTFSGYALPGVVLALGLVFFFNNFIPWLYGTPVMIVVAYLIRFLPQSLQAQEAALTQVSPNLEEAARMMGESTWGALRKITLPLVRPGLLAGWGLVFVSSMKELPASLLLRPPGFETLAIRVWVDAGEGFYEAAAPAALFLLVVAVLPMRWLMQSKNESGRGCT